MTPKNESEPASKADLNAVRSELKTEIKAVNHRLGLGITKTNERIDSLERTLRDKMRENTSRILGAIDAFCKKSEAYDQKSFSHGDILQSHESRFGDHEKRISALETKH